MNAIICVLFRSSICCFFVFIFDKHFCGYGMNELFIRCCIYLFFFCITYDEKIRNEQRKSKKIAVLFVLGKVSISISLLKI